MSELHHKKPDRSPRKTCAKPIRCIIINLTQAKEHKRGDYLWNGRNEGRTWRRFGDVIRRPASGFGGRAVLGRRPRSF